MTKVPISEILVTRIEGPAAQCVRQSFKTFRQANRHLSSIDSSVDKGVHKVDFLVIYADSETYKGKIEARNQLSDGYTPPDLGMHMRMHLEYSAGLRRPAHWTDEKYEAFREKMNKEKPASEDTALAFLKKYAFTDIVSSIDEQVPAVTVDPDAQVFIALRKQLAECESLSVTELNVQISRACNKIQAVGLAESSYLIMTMLSTAGKALRHLELEQVEDKAPATLIATSMTLVLDALIVNLDIKALK